MRRGLGVLVLLALLAAGTGCETDQPLDAGTQSLSVSMRASGPGILYDAYEIWRDTSMPPDGTLEFTGSYECQSRATVVPPLGFITVDLPIPFNISVSVIRAGTTTEEVIASTDPGTPFGNLTAYFPDPPAGALGAAGTPDPGSQTPGVLELRNGRRVLTGTVQELSLCHRSFLDPITGAPPTPNLLGQPLPASIDLDLEQGDALILRARKAPSGQAFAPFIDTVVPASLIPSAFLDGREVPLQGDLEADNGGVDGGGVTLSFVLN